MGKLSLAKMECAASSGSMVSQKEHGKKQNARELPERIRDVGRDLDCLRQSYYRAAV
jgi:hypothetical protein